VTIDDRPIRVWVYDGNGPVKHIRVVGHATEAICRQVSAALVDATASPHLDGFFSYGVADLVSKDEAGQRELMTLASMVEALASANPDDVDVHHVSTETDVQFATHSTIPQLDEDVALVGVLDDSLPPAFVPVRTWDGHTTTPLELTFAARDLGLSAKEFKRLSGDVGVAPWIDAVSLLRQEVSELEGYLEWIKQGKKIDLGVGGIDPAYRKREGLSDVRRALAAAQRVVNASNALVEFQRVIRKLGFPAVVQDASLEAVLRGASHVVEFDTACIRFVSECDEYVDVTIPPPSAGLRGLISEVLDSATPENAALVKSLISRDREELKVAQNAIAAARSKIQLPARQEREALVDAILRGWPASMATDADMNLLLKLITKQVPVTWNKALAALDARGVRLSGPQVGGDLLGSSLFYAVHEDDAGVFHVVPTYIVHGKYSEVWSSQRHTVTVEQPHD
jgi:hypothetical protein